MGGSPIRKVLVLSGLTVLLLVALAEPAAATRFSGHCTQEGVAKFFPPRRVMPVPSGYETATTGRCRGLLDGKPFNGPASHYAYADMKSPMGCIIGASTRGGPAYMRFARGELDALRKPGQQQRPKDPPDVQLDVVADEANITGVLPTHFEGAYRGHTVGVARFLIGPDKAPDLMRRCLGEGLDQLGIAFEFDTIQELYG